MWALQEMHLNKVERGGDFGDFNHLVEKHTPIPLYGFSFGFMDDHNYHFKSQAIPSTKSQTGYFFITADVNHQLTIQQFIDMPPWHNYQPMAQKNN